MPMYICESFRGLKQTYPSCTRTDRDWRERHQRDVTTFLRV